MKDKVVLFYPPYSGPPLGAPLCLLSLASPLLEAGFRVSLIDGAVESDFERVIAREIDEALCLGISILAGPMIGSATKISHTVRRIRPGLPIVFGGWHPSLLPDQTLTPDFVDVVVRGQGELTLVEIAERLAEGKSLEGVRGASFKKGGEIVQNSERPVENINHLPPPAFRLVDFDAYERVRGRREVGYATSVGCPYACNYCTDQAFYQRPFYTYRAERGAREVSRPPERYRAGPPAVPHLKFPPDVKRHIPALKGL